jgi:hypothetical protein
LLQNCEATVIVRQPNQDASMQIHMIHNGRDRDSLLMPMDAGIVDLMLQYSIQLVRCEPTTRFNVSR